MEASDGSQQVKIWLQCPSCRSDLSGTIRDTLLLRKVDSLKTKVPENKSAKTSEYTESEKRLQEALDTSKDLRKTVSDSRKREEEFFGPFFLHKLREEKKESEDLESLEENDTLDDGDNSWSMSSSNVEEWGVEADLLNGIHTSFRMPRPSCAPPQRSVTSILVENSRTDSTLFYGLDFFLPEEDREYLTRKMLSGKQTDLAEAAEILAKVAKSLKNNPGGELPRSFVPKAPQRVLDKRSSIFGLVEDVEAVHLKKEQKASRDLREQAQLLGQQSTPTRGNHRIQRRQSVLLLAQNQRDFPLPVRLPKFVSCRRRVLQENFGLLDHEWDGTVLDAFSKITIGFRKNIKQTPSSHKGVLNMLGGTEARIELPGQSRVILAKVHRTIGQQGVTKGDVLTHINGECISGEKVEEVERLLSEAGKASDQLQLVFNAERSVAEGLRRRAMAKTESNS